MMDIKVFIPFVLYCARSQAAKRAGGGVGVAGCGLRMGGQAQVQVSWSGLGFQAGRR